MIRLVLSAALLAVIADGQALTTQYSSQKAYRVEVASSFSMETVDFSMERDGEPFEGGRGGGMSTEETRRVVMLDTVIEAKDGAPTQVRRSFEEISATSFRIFGENERENERECPLNGVVLDLTLDDGEVVAEVVDGETPENEELLQGHQLALALDALLPEGEVEVDEAWELDEDAIVRTFGFDVEKALFPTPQAEPRGEGRGEGRGRRGGGMRFGGGGAARYFENGDWEAEATLEADTEEYEGVECHVIVIEAEASGELPERERGGRGGGRGGEERVSGFEVASPLFENSFELELEGKLYFSVEGGHPLHLEVEGQLTTESVREMERRESFMVISTSQEGTFNYTVDVTPVLSDEGEE